jgi:hypothetical protein
MAQLALAYVGSWIGGTYFAAGAFGLTGAQIGWAIGSIAGSMLFGPDMPDQTGPRLQDKSVQSSAYGTMIPIIKGRMRISGNVIWSTDLVEISNTQSYGGKGGGGGTTTTFSYYANAAISICEGEKLVRKVWADGKLIYDITSTNTGYTGSDLPLRFYPGSETQEPDPLIESVQGVGATPAYRGQCYMVMEQFPLAQYGNRLPNFTFEVIDGTLAYPAVNDLGAGSFFTFDNNGRLWVVVPGSDRVDVWDTETQTLLASNTVTSPFDTQPQTPFYVEERDEIWVSNIGSAAGDVIVMMWRFSPTSLSEIGTIDITSFGSPRAGPMVYSKNIRKVLVFNGYSGTNTNRFIDVDTLAVTTGVTSRPVTHSILIDNHNFAVSWGTGLAGLLITDIESGITLNIITGPLASTQQDVYYDADRDSLLWVRDDGNVYEVNLTTFEVTTVYTSATELYSIAKSTNGYYYLGAFFSPNSSLVILDSDFNLVDTIATGGVGEVGYGDRMFLLNDKLWAVGGNIGLGILPHVKLATSDDPTLASVVTFLSEEAGLTASDIDVSAMTEDITGYFITRAAPARTLMEPLLATYRYDGVESDNVIKFVKRGGASVASITDDDLVMENETFKKDNSRTQEPELPRRINIMYANPDSDYQQGSQFSQRMVGSSIQVIGIELPLVLTDDEAKRIADVTMYDAYASRTALDRNLSRKYSLLEPTDVITYDSGDVIYRLRIANKDEGGPGVSRLRLIADDLSINTFSGPGAPSPTPDSTLLPLAVTRIELMDTTLFRDTDDDIGFYVAACGTNASWQGCVLYKSADDGETWNGIATLTEPATMGAALGELVSGRTDIFDETNTVTVRLTYGTLSSTTHIAAMNGANACLIGDEVLTFKVATLNGDGTYTLSGLRRGRRGTERYVGTHAAGDRFVLLSASTAVRITLGSAEIAAERLYKAVTIGGFLDNTAAKTFTCNNVGQECYDPVHLSGGRNGVGSLTLKWLRRSRIGAAWRDYADIALGETSEAYDVEIWDTSSYTTLMRTFTDQSTHSVIYTNSMQFTDFGGNQAIVYTRIYQKSSVMGRGFVLEGAI